MKIISQQNEALINDLVYKFEKGQSVVFGDKRPLDVCCCVDFIHQLNL